MKHKLPSLNPAETFFGIVFLFAQALLIPIALGMFVIIFKLRLSDAELNTLCFGANFVCAAVIFCKYWITALQELSEKWGSVLLNAIRYFIIYYGATILLNYLIYYLDPEFSNANDNSIAAMTEDSKLLITISVVLLVPPVEEMLYRGLVFGKLYEKAPFLGYLVSMLLFASVHVVSYIGTVPPLRLLLCLLQYLPAGYCLARAYVSSGSLFTPILIHATINLIAVSLM